MGWFLRALAFRTLHYPWGKMETNRSLRTTRLFLQKPKRDTSYWVQFFSDDIISFFTKRNLLIESLKMTKSFVRACRPLRIPLPNAIQANGHPTGKTVARTLHQDIVFSFSWGYFNSQEKLKTMLMQNFGVTNKEHYSVLWYFLEWSIVWTSWRGIEYVTVRKRNWLLCCWRRVLCFIVISSEKIHFLGPLKLSNNTFNYWKLNHWKMKSKSFDWRSHNSIWAIEPCSPNMVIVHVSSKLASLLHAIAKPHVSFYFVQFALNFGKDLLPPPVLNVHFQG